MLIGEKKLKYWIDNFYGFGSWDAKFWFISLEEAGGDVPEDVADKINWFSEHQNDPHSLCDIRELYKNVALNLDSPKGAAFKTRFDYRFGDKAVQHGVWKNLILFVHGYEDKKLPDLLAYQKKRFGQREALIAFYPLPSPHNHAWYYSWLDMPSLPFLKSRLLYEDHLYETRISTILSKIREHKPELVLMYGMNNINSLKESVGGQFKLAKAEKLVTPQYHQTNVGATKLVITTQIPALRHGRVETGFDWHQFGKLLR